MRRRFAFMELHPSMEPVASVLRRWLVAHGHPGEAAALLDALNARIHDSDFRIGPSYFMRDWIHTDPDGLDTVWTTDLLPLLAEHHAGDGTNVAEWYGLERIRAITNRNAPAAPAQPEPPDVTSGDAEGAG
jgi:5-methylcytosine-specific restriction protein B